MFIFNDYSVHSYSISV